MNCQYREKERFSLNTLTLSGLALQRRMFVSPEDEARLLGNLTIL
jgi:hypothetical protein